jgi:hypothetical protein
LRIHYIDLALSSVAILFVATGILVSAAGMEQTTVLMVVLGLGLLSVFLGLGWLAWRNFKQKSARPVLVAIGITFLILASVPTTDWPLRATYSISLEELDTLGQRIKAGERLNMPQRAGVFTIQKAEISNEGIVCLWTRPALGGNTGFVQCKPDYVPFNLWSVIRLHGGWQLIAED